MGRSASFERVGRYLLGYRTRLRPCFIVQFPKRAKSVARTLIYPNFRCMQRTLTLNPVFRSTAPQTPKSATRACPATAPLKCGHGLTCDSAECTVVLIILSNSDPWHEETGPSGAQQGSIPARSGSTSRRSPVQVVRSIGVRSKSSAQICQWRVDAGPSLTYIDRVVRFGPVVMAINTYPRRTERVLVPVLSTPSSTPEAPFAFSYDGRFNNGR